MTDNRYDIIIIGTGAGGGTLAYHLAPSGKRILILERGDYVPREKANWDPQVVNVDAHYNTKESWLDKDGKELHPHTNYYVGSLAPSDPQYRGRYTGGPTERDGAYHQGTVWPWLMGPFITAYVKVNGDSEAARRQAAAWLAPLKDHLADGGLGHISEILDGDSPQRPCGCIAQAWSVAEILRALVEDVYGLRPMPQPQVPTAQARGPPPCGLRYRDRPVCGRAPIHKQRMYVTSGCSVSPEDSQARARASAQAGQGVPAPSSGLPRSPPEKNSCAALSAACWARYGHRPNGDSSLGHFRSRDGLLRDLLPGAKRLYATALPLSSRRVRRSRLPRPAISLAKHHGQGSKIPAPQ